MKATAYRIRSMSTIDPTDVNAQEQQLEAVSTRVERKELQEAADIRWLMGHKQGRRIMWKLLEKAGVYRTSFTGNSETFFREGKRSLGLEFLGDVMTHAPDRFTTMIDESKS